MLGVLQQPIGATQVQHAQNPRKFVLRFVNRSELLSCVAILRDCGARVSGDAPPGEPLPNVEVDVKPQLSFVPPLMHLKDATATSADNNSSQQWWAGSTQPNNNNNTAPALLDQQSGASLKRKQSSVDDAFEGFDNIINMSSQFQHQQHYRAAIDENAPPNKRQVAEMPPSLQQRVMAVLSAPDFESQLAAVERALMSVIQRDTTARRRWTAVQQQAQQQQQQRNNGE